MSRRARGLASFANGISDRNSHMRYFISIIFILAPSSPLLAQEKEKEPDWNFKNPQAKKALNGFTSQIAKQNKDREAAIKKIDDEAKKDRKKHRHNLIMSLEKALKKSLEDRDLEEANKIDAAIKALKKGEKPSVAISAGKKVRIPKDTVKWKGHSYRVFTTPMTWHAAKEYCESLGGHLVRIESADENAVVLALVRQRKPTRTWIDGTDEIAEGTWLFSNGKRIKYANWFARQPDNSGKKAHSMEFWPDHDGAWNDEISGVRKFFICEWDQ